MLDQEFMLCELARALKERPTRLGYFERTGQIPTRTRGTGQYRRWSAQEAAQIIAFFEQRDRAKEARRQAAERRAGLN
jgi:DNA-binding transcriptional MerR regulator